MRIAEMTRLGEITFREAPRPTPAAGEAVVRIRAVGLCGTDLKAFVRGHPFFPPPCVLGHESAGTIEAVGEGVTRFAHGDRVVAAPYVECGVCGSCRSGLGQLCRNKAYVDGALQEYVLLPGRVVSEATFRLPDETSYAVGTLTEPLACVINGIEKAGVSAGDSVLVVGGGPMGAILALVARSITPHVVVSEISASRAAALSDLDLDVIDPAAGPVVDRLMDAFGRPSASKVLIAVGLAAVAEEAIGWTAPGGTALLFGGLPKEAELTVDPYAIHYNEVTLTGSFGFRLEHFRRAVAWLEGNGALAARIVTSTVPFSSVASGFELARRAEGLKTVVMIGEDDDS